MIVIVKISISVCSSVIGFLVKSRLVKVSVRVGVVIRFL